MILFETYRISKRPQQPSNVAWRPAALDATGARAAGAAGRILFI